MSIGMWNKCVYIDSQIGRYIEFWKKWQKHKKLSTLLYMLSAICNGMLISFMEYPLSQFYFLGILNKKSCHKLIIQKVENGISFSFYDHWMWQVLLFL